MFADQLSTDVKSPLGSVLLPKHEVETEEEMARNSGSSSRLALTNAFVVKCSIATKNLFFSPVPRSQSCPATWLLFYDMTFPSSLKTEEKQAVSLNDKLRERVKVEVL